MCADCSILNDEDIQLTMEDALELSAQIKSRQTTSSYGNQPKRQPDASDKCNQIRLRATEQVCKYHFQSSGRRTIQLFQILIIQLVIIYLVLYWAADQ